MKHPCLIFLYVVAFLYLSLSACTAPRQTASLSDENTKQLYNYYYTEGERQRVLGNNEAAFVLLSEASRIDTSAPAGQFALANYYMQLNRPDTAIYMLHKAAEGDTTQYWYNFFYARITSLAGLNDEATRIWRRLIRQHPDKPELNSALANSLLAQGDVKAALACYDSLENSTGPSEPLTIKKMELYEQMGDTVAMIAEAEKLQQTYPSNTSYMLLLGDVYANLHRDSAAWEMYEKVSRIEPDNGYLYLSRASYYALQGDSTAYHREMKTALANSNIDMETKLGIFREYIAALVAKQVNLEALDTLYVNIIEQYPQEPLVRQLYGFYLYVIKDYTRASEQYSIAADLAPTEADTWVHLIALYLMDEQYERAIETGYRALQYIHDTSTIYEMTSAALVQQKRYDEAAQLLINAINQCTNITPQQQSSLYGQLGDIYHQTGQTDKAYEQYDKALNLYASNIAVLNNYSYFLALEGKELSKAERMSAMTIKEFPDEPTYLDTYAYILFRKESYSLARIYIERAIEKSKEPSAEILEHYGDILACLGDTDAAVEQWQKALDAGGEKERLETKIEKREYIAP